MKSGKRRKKEDKQFKELRAVKEIIIVNLDTYCGEGERKVRQYEQVML